MAPFNELFSLLEESLLCTINTIQGDIRCISGSFIVPDYNIVINHRV